MNATDISVPSSTPPTPSWLISSHGKGLTGLGDAKRIATTVVNKVADYCYGPQTGIEESALANRTSRMRSNQLYELLMSYSKKTNLSFSAYMCFNPVQTFDANFLGEHLRTLKMTSKTPDDTVWVLPLYLKPESYFNEEHMTVLVVTSQFLEFYDSLGKAMHLHSWTNETNLFGIAKIAHEVLFPSTPLILAENYTPHQTDATMCGLFVSLWIHHRFIEGKTQREWIDIVNNTSDFEIRKKVSDLLIQTKSETESDEEVEDEEERAILFDFEI